MSRCVPLSLAGLLVLHAGCRAREPATPSVAGASDADVAAGTRADAATTRAPSDPRDSERRVDGARSIGATSATHPNRTSADARARWDNPNHPVVYSWGDGSARVLGGSTGGAWKSDTDLPITGSRCSTIEDCQNTPATTGEAPPNEASTELIRPGDPLAFYGCSDGVCEPLGVEKAGSIGLTFAGSTGDSYLWVDGPGVESSGGGLDRLRVGVHGAWNAVPRPITRSGNELIVDLDGDGTKDVLRVAHTVYPGPEAFPAEEYGIEHVDGAQVIRLRTIGLDPIYEREWQWGLLDLNGDGKLEIVVVTSGHNESAVVSEGSQRVLDWYMGD